MFCNIIRSMWSFHTVLLVCVLNLYFVKAVAEDEERRYVDKIQRPTADDKPSWSYNGNSDGQQFWDDIGYPDCGGKSQSPIYIKYDDAIKDNKIPLFDFEDFNHGFENMRLTNTGRTLKLELPDYEVDIHNVLTPSFTDGGLGPGRFYFQEIIFHFGETNTEGSEHRYSSEPGKDARPTVLELQMIFKNENGTTAVIAQIFEVRKVGQRSSFLRPIINAIPKVKYQGESTNISEGISIAELFFTRFHYEHYYRYNGSLTYPPCTEGVIWTIYNIVGVPDVTYEQMKQFRTLMSTKRGSKDPQPLAGNFRRLQKLNGRKYYSRL